MSPPVSTANTNAIHVIGSTAAVVCATVRSREATPRSRRSTIAIEPMTTVRASTCTHSIQGKRLSPSRIAVAIALSCRVWRNCSNGSGSLNVGDPSACADNGDPERDRGYSDELPCPSSTGRQLPESRVTSNGQLTSQSRAGRGDQQSHLQQEHGVFQRSRGLGHDENGSGSRKHRQRPPDKG